MTVLTLSTDAWEGLHANNETVPVSDWEQIEEALLRLDGRTHTQIALGCDDGSTLLVGGGPDRFNVSIELAEDRFFTLLDRSKVGNGAERLVTGGQMGEFPAETVVGMDAALRATRVFYELGVPDATLDWEEY